MGDVFPYCMKKYREKCLSPMFKAVADYLIIDRVPKNMEKFCEKGDGTIRDSEYKFIAKINNNQI